MKRKTSAAPTRIWNFGMRVSRETEAELLAELRLAHDYYNELVALELKRRARFREARSKLADIDQLETAYASADAALTEARDALKRQRQKARKRVKDPEAQRQIEALREARKVASEALKEGRARVRAAMEPAERARKLRTEERLVEIGKSGPRIRERVNREILAQMLAEDWPEIWKAGARANAEVVEERKRLRAAVRVHWGTYLLVEQAVQSAVKGPRDPRFRRWDGTGRLGVQLKRMTVGELFGGKDGLLQIDPLPADQWETLSKTRKAFTEARMRLWSERGEERWAHGSVWLHRPVPEDAVVTWAWIKASRCGRRRTFSLQLTVESTTFVPHAPKSRGTVAIDLGWRVREGGVRVGYCYDDHNRTRELVMPEQIRDQLWLSDQLRSYSDQHFDAARAVLRNWMEAHRVPTWLAERTEHMALWRAHGKLAVVARDWAKERFSEERLAGLWQDWKSERLGANRDLFADYAEIQSWQQHREPFSGHEDHIAWYLWLWERKDAHLYRFASDVRRKACNRRKDLYRVWAKQLAQQYETIVVEDFDLRQFTRNAAPEEESAEKDAFHRLMKDASPGELRSAIINAAGPSRVQTVPAEYSTMTCHRCGHVNPDVGAPLVATCESCGVSWDQDDNAARILLRRWFEGSGGDGTPGAARGPGSGPESDDGEAPKGVVEGPPKRARRGCSQSGREGPEIAAE